MGNRHRLPAIGVAVCVTLATVLNGCGSADLTPQAGVPSSQRDYLISPLEGVSEQLEPGVRDRIEVAYRALVDSGDSAAALSAAEQLLSLDPLLASARVLAAQGEFVARHYGAVVDRLAPHLDDTTVAGLLVLGRAAELDGFLPAAYDAYRRAADRNPVAARRAKALQERAWDALMKEFDGELESSRFADARATLDRLESWAPERLGVIDARRRLAFANGDREAELEALRILMEPGREARSDPELAERLGRLELEIGEPRRGLEIFEELLRRKPEDPRLEEQVAQAKFLWRLEMLPPDVQDLAQRSELTRGDFATLLYWVVPNVRSGGSSEARIATDVLDHPQRDAIVRVLNLGLMQVEDDTLHRFAPDDPLSRRDALETLLRIPLEFGDGVACVSDFAVLSAPTASFVCQTAVRCNLVPTTDDCLLGAALSGREALDLIRRALVLLGEG